MLSEGAAETAMLKNLEQSWIKLVRNAEKITEPNPGSQSLTPRSGQGSPRRTSEEESLCCRGNGERKFLEEEGSQQISKELYKLSPLVLVFKRSSVPF